MEGHIRIGEVESVCPLSVATGPGPKARGRVHVHRQPGDRKEGQPGPVRRGHTGPAPSPSVFRRRGQGPTSPSPRMRPLIVAKVSNSPERFYKTTYRRLINNTIYSVLGCLVSVTPGSVSGPVADSVGSGRPWPTPLSAAPTSWSRSPTLSGPEAGVAEGRRTFFFLPQARTLHPCFRVALSRRFRPPASPLVPRARGGPVQASRAWGRGPRRRGCGAARGGVQTWDGTREPGGQSQGPGACEKDGRP